jgi:hypothetical protein
MLQKLAGVLLVLLTFGAVESHADSVYQMTGSLTIPGDSANPTVSETINFSFELDYSPLGEPYLVTVVGAPVVSSVGPLGDFTLFAAAVPSNAMSDYIAFYSPLYGTAAAANGYAEIDLLGNFIVPAPSITGETWFYTCSNPAVPCSEFTFTSPGNEYPHTATATICAVPEPGTLGLGVLGILALFLGKRHLSSSGSGLRSTS